MGRKNARWMPAALVFAVGACTGCVALPDAEPSASASATPPSYVERLKVAPVKTLEGASQDGGPLAFVTPDHNVACALTDRRGGHLDLPYEPNDYAAQANTALPTVPVVQCELGSYPKPEPADVKDDCAGTGLGYLGGEVLLVPSGATYGACRSGVNQVEAEPGPKGKASGPVSQLPPLDTGAAVERNGYRCAPLDDGVACANLSNGAGFFVARNRYVLLPAS